MFEAKNIVYIWSVLIIVTDASINLPKQCNLADGDCKRLVYQSIYRQLAGGDPKSKIPQADPVQIKNFVFVLPNSVKLTLEDGVLTGLKNCDFEAMNTYLKEKYYSTLNLTCDVEINGKYNVEVPKTVMSELGGEDISADVITGSGKGKVTMVRSHFLLYVPFVLKTVNNEVYLHAQNLKLTHGDDNNAVFSIEDFDVGNKANGEKIASYLKEHANELNQIAPVTEKVLEFFNLVITNIMYNIPAKQLFSDDISSLV